MKHVKLFVIFLLLLLSSALAGFAQAGAAGKSAVVILPYKDFQDVEFKKPRAKLEDAGVALTVASSQTGTAKGQSGARVDVDMTYADVVVADYDLVVFIGGKGSRTMSKHPEAQRIAREAMEQGKLVGAICYAPVVLARADVLDGRTATAADIWGSVPEMKKAGCSYKKSKVVVDGNLITANGPKAAGSFGTALVEALEAL